MNLVGKIFTFLIFVMCVVFGTFALMVHAAHKNWREVVVAPKVGLNDKLEDAKKLEQKLLDEKKNLETALNDEKARTQRRLIALEEQKKSAVAERDENERKLQIEEGKSRELALAISGVHQRLGVLQTAIDRMRDAIKTGVEERNSTQKVLLDTTDKLMNAVAERERLVKLGKELAAQSLKLKEALSFYKLSADGDYKGKDPPPVEGEVTSAPRPDVVEISIGADDGIRKGHKFVVTRPSTGRYIGMIEVIQVDYPNRAVCRPDKSTLTDQIQKGDHVKANLSKVR
ncbi:MAG: hypothetical protein WCJ35_09340 [Planctomycetota bacterium]